LGKRLPAVGRLILLTTLSCVFTTLGISSAYFVANKENDFFNTTVAVSIFNPPQPLTALLGIVFSPNDIAVYPINDFLYLEIANRTGVQRRISGISAEIGQQKWWWPWSWPTWTKLCPVDLRAMELTFGKNPKNLTRLGNELNLDVQIRDKPIGANDTAAGWIAFECPKNAICAPGLLRIGVSDTTGAVSWQVVTKPAIEPTLQNSSLHITGLPPVDLTSLSFRTLSSCRP
jgi:hypothetical protein